MNNKNSGPTQAPTSNNSDITPITTELQSITSITPTAPEESGCGIESLGDNSLEGCSADAFTEAPLQGEESSATEITDLNFLDSQKNEPNDNNSTPESGVTNILDLQ